MRTLINLQVLLAAFLLAGCQSLPKVETETAPNTDFSAYKTFAVLMPKESQAAEDPGMYMRISGPAQQAVIDDLTLRGLSQAELDEADICVNLRGKSLPKINVDSYGYNYVGFGRYGRLAPVYAGTTEVTTTNERTLIVEIYDNQTRQMVWVGWASKESTEKVEAEKVVEAIHHILMQVPVGTPPPPPPAS
jgi:hypothetical protein